MRWHYVPRKQRRFDRVLLGILAVEIALLVYIWYTW